MFSNRSQNGSQSEPPHSLRFALFLTGLVWSVAARLASIHAARGLTQALHAFDWQPLFRESSFLFLLAAGFSALSWIATRVGPVRQVNALPQRSTSWQEWRLGAALGWALLLFAVLPMILTGSLHPEFSTSLHDFFVLLPSVAALLVGSLAIEVAFRGFLFRQLIDSIHPAAATVVMSGIFALASSFGIFGPHAGARSVQVTFVAGILFSMAYLRTHGLWLGWGLRFGWGITTAILFGLPLSGTTDYSSVIFTNTGGPVWLTGGAYGPDGSLWTAAVLFLGMALLYALTRDYAWSYTHAAIVPGGYPMEVAPPAAHTAMEAAAKPVLVQIAPSTSVAASTLPQAEAAILSRDTQSLED